ncbi:Protein CBR-LMP-1 [Caenorhabditis briggsae]|uniref:Protein CBR-LMP-1 n=1 Tax=Caenorhabditis briggsae TaxID=6238 RepID=A8WZ24_CAEBR|nr:Protein CBR-LMP-1 [Caenorhabditis briggsae]CAP25634.2 Protein CBR-LMP-1 [Caenorhabditis briggsae]
MSKSLVAVFALLAVASAEHFYVTNNNTGLACIIVDGDFMFNLVFQEGNATQKYNVLLNNTLNVDGDCNAVVNNQSVQTLSITFNPAGQSARYPKEWELNIVFGTSSNEAFKIIDYTLKTQKTELVPYFGTFVRDEKDAGDVTATETNAYKVCYFRMPSLASPTSNFQCSTAKLGLVGGSTIDIKTANIIAFAQVNGTVFPANQLYDVCYLDARTSDVVPIVVGACLAVLVIVVLVGYLIGRARAKRQGYASV